MVSSPTRKVVIDKILHDSEEGQFRANDTNIGWRASDGGRTVIHSTSSVKKAEWLEGKLRVALQEQEDAETQLLALDGFAAKDFDELWRFFEQNCSVYLKKHKAQAAISEDAFDKVAKAIELAADQVDEAAWGSVQKRAREADLMVKVESIRNGLDQALSGDREALSRVFAANGCERIGRLRLVVDTVQLEVYATDPRWTHLVQRALSVESVLKDLGRFRQWVPREDDSTMSRRQMVRELKRKQSDDDIDTTAAVQGSYAAPVVNPLQTPMPKPVPAGPLAPAPEFQPPARAAASAPPPTLASTPASTNPLATNPLQAVAARGREAGEKSDDEDEEVVDPNKASAAPPSERNEIENPYRTPGSIREGWVWKRSRYLKRWRRRWLILMPTELRAYKARRQAKPTETIEKGIRAVNNADVEARQKFCFSILSGRRTFYMVCDSEADRQEWMRDLSSALCA